MIRTLASAALAALVAGIALTISVTAVLWWTTADVVRHRFAH